MITEELIRQIARDISRRLLAGELTADLSRASSAPATPCPVDRSAHLPVLNPQLPTSQHPSQQRVQARDSLNEFIDFLQTKQCIMEKNKPCDQCDICNTLGF